VNTDNIALCFLQVNDAKKHCTPCVILIKDHRKPEPLVWKFPGGTGEMAIDEPETPRETMMREILEETGIDIAYARNVTLQDYGTVQARSQRGPYDVHMFGAVLDYDFVMNEVKRYHPHPERHTWFVEPDIEVWLAPVAELVENNVEFNRNHARWLRELQPTLANLILSHN